MDVRREIPKLVSGILHMALRRYPECERLFTVAESCTGGLLSGALTSIPGASAVYPGGFITYSNEAKICVLGVSESTIASHGAVSSLCAAEMARGASRIMQTDFALSVTGIAGPGGGSSEKPVGLVWIALAAGKRTVSRKLFFPGRPRSIVRLLSVRAALKLLLEGLGSEGTRDK